MIEICIKFFDVLSFMFLAAFFPEATVSSFENINVSHIEYYESLTLRHCILDSCFVVMYNSLSLKYVFYICLSQKFEMSVTLL